MEKFDDIFDARKNKIKAKLDTDLTADDLKAIIDDYKKLVKKETEQADFPQDAARAAMHVARRRVPLLVEPEAKLLPQDGKDSDDIGTAANVQAMVFGNMGETPAPASASPAIPAPARRSSTASSW